MQNKPKRPDNDLPEVIKRARRREPMEQSSPAQATDDPYRVREKSQEACEKARFGDSNDKK
jgi:hypothetical protein